MSETHKILNHTIPIKSLIKVVVLLSDFDLEQSLRTFFNNKTRTYQETINSNKIDKKMIIMQTKGKSKQKNRNT